MTQFAVPFLDLAAAYQELKPGIDAAVHRVLSSGWYVGGVENERFEAQFAAYCGAEAAVGVANGLDALHLTLRALGIGAGDEVIVASNSYIATVLAVSLVGAKPVLIEPDPATSNLDPSRIESAINSRTKAILPTHMYGNPADLDGILSVARKHNLNVIEDAAQAHGARYRGDRIGAASDAVCWSFYPSKNLGALGDAGAVTSNDRKLIDRIRTLGNYGSSERYVNDVQGVNSRLDPLQAAVLSVKLDHLDEWNKRRADIAQRYMTGLADCGISLPTVAEGAESAWHLFVVHSPARDALRRALELQSIATQVHYPIPPHLQRAYVELGFGAGSFPIAERLAAEALSLPIGPHLSRDQADRVVDTVRAITREAV